MCAGALEGDPRPPVAIEHEGAPFGRTRAGLLPGDTVIVERRHAANEGDIVVAIVDDEYTIKRLGRERGRFILKPENKAYPILRPKELEIFGIVVGSYRKYR